MKTNQLFIISLLIFILVFSVPESAMAAPGGAIAKGLFKSFWGKLLLAALVIIFLPLIIYINIREYIGVKKTKKVLEKLSIKNKEFQWMNLQKEVKNIYQRVHIAWDKEKMDDVSEYVTPWYWQNQQMVFLDEWSRKGLKNVCKVRSYDKVKPLYISVSEENNYLGSKIAFSITAKMEDYLLEKETGDIVEGKPGYESIEKVWIMELTEKGWKLDDIHESSMSLAFAKLENEIPETVKSSLGMA